MANTQRKSIFCLTLFVLGWKSVSNFLQLGINNLNQLTSVILDSINFSDEDLITISEFRDSVRNYKHSLQAINEKKSSCRMLCICYGFLVDGAAICFGITHYIC